MKPTPKIVIARAALTLVALTGLTSAGRYIADNRALNELQCADSYSNFLLSSHTLSALAMQCVGDAELGRAEAYAVEALRRQPMSQLALASLGSVAELSGAADLAELWFIRASSVGRRDLTAGTYWMARFAERRDPIQVAVHLDALLRAGWNSQEAVEQGRQLEATAVGRDALLRVLTPDSPWSLDFLSDVSGLSEEALENRTKTLALIAAESATSSVMFSAVAGLPAVRELYKRGRIKAAYDLTTRIEPGRTQSIIPNPQFKAVESSANSPFDWTIRHSAGLDLNYGARTQSKAGLSLHAINPGRYPIAEQVVRLDPGHYRVELLGNGPPTEDTNFVINFAGVQEGERVGPRQIATPTSVKPSTDDFLVSGADQFFRLSVALDVGASGSGREFELSSLTVTKR